MQGLDEEVTEAATESGGTQAASPHAIATGSKGALSHPSATSATVSPSPRDLPRIHMFHLFGVIAPLAAIAIIVPLGADPTARLAVCIGLVIVALCNLGLVWMTARASRYRAHVAEVLWITSVVSTQPIILYFGPFSGAVMVNVIGILFVSFGRTRWTAQATVAICIGVHAAMVVPIILGWVRDRGMLSSAYIEHRYQLVVAEVFMAGLMASAYSLGRWARRTNSAAASELQSAMRILGDKEQALAEVKDEAARAQRVDEGRWSGQMMGSYKLGFVLGRGAMGEVYEATAPDGTPAALKLLNARATTSTSLVERFHREMEVAARLESPHIVRVFELSPPDAPVPYIAMERLHGTDLAARLRSENRMPSDELVALIDQVARGLEVARIAGVVHRDLKPHNLFQHDGVWKILDFGVSKLLGAEGTLTGEGIVGTPQYMAPEQASGGHVTHLADVYALGAIAYRCLTGRSPFKGKDLSELIYQVVHAPPVRPSTFTRVSPAIEDVLGVALAKDPRRRFPSALSFARAFVAARRGQPVVLDPPADAWQP